MAIERSYVEVSGKFDPTREDHVQRVVATVVASNGPGWVFTHFDAVQRRAYVERRTAVTTARGQSGRVRLLSLGKGYGPGDGDRAAAQLEALPEYAGYVMTRYDPYADEVELTRLTPQEVRARGATATALGVKPWEVQVAGEPGGGFRVVLPPSYSPSRHDPKLLEVATTVVGRAGWYLDVDVPALRLRYVPATPPSFPAVIPYPMAVAEEFARDGRKLLFGKSLAVTGDQEGDWVAVDVASTPHFTVNGTTGAGKTSTINSIIRSAVIAGMELAIVDVPHKAVDYTWVKPYVRAHGWGCESLADAVVVLKLLYREGERRARVLKSHDVEKVAKLPESVQASMPPILVVVDELSGLLQLTDKLLGLPKDHPDRVAAANENALHSMLLGELLKIASQMRFVGLHLCLSTQVANSTTGIPPKLRTLLGGKLLLGVNQNRNNRAQTFNDPDSVPEVPEQLRVDAGAGRGSGTAELEGQRPVVFKSVFADVAGHREVIGGLARLTAGMAEPLEEHRRELLSFLYEDADGEPLPQLPDGGSGFRESVGGVDGVVDWKGDRLRGAAAAAAYYARQGS